jgi:hypothetical protein
MTVRDHLVAAARTDLTWLERRHERWVAECRSQRTPKFKPRSTRWLAYSERDLAQARFRLERYLEAGEVDVRDHVTTTAQV